MKAILLLVVAISCVAHATEAPSVGIADAGRATPDVTQAICAHNEGCTPCERLNTLDIRLPLTHTNLVPNFLNAKSFSLGVTTPWPVATTEFERDGVRYTTGRCAYNIISHGFETHHVLKTDVRSFLQVSHLLPQAGGFPQVAIDLNVTFGACTVDGGQADDMHKVAQLSRDDLRDFLPRGFRHVLDAPTERAHYVPWGPVCADFTVTVLTEQLNTAYYRLGLNVFSVATRRTDEARAQADASYVDYFTGRTISDETMVALVGLLMVVLVGAVYGCCKYRAARIAHERKTTGYTVIKSTKSTKKPATVGEYAQAPAAAAMLVAEVEADVAAQE